MAKIKYNIKLWADTAANLATDTTDYKENDFIFATDSGVIKKVDVKTMQARTIDAVATWENSPYSTFASAHDHTVMAMKGWLGSASFKGCRGVKRKDSRFR